MGRLGAARLAQMVLAAAEGPAGADPTSYFTRLARHAAVCTGGAAVGLLSAGTDGGSDAGPAVATGSDERVRGLERRQQEAGAGPAVDAIRTGHASTGVVLAGTLEGWPSFSGAALAAGFTVVHTLPLRRDAEVFAALDVLLEPGQAVDASQLQVVQALADAAAAALLRARTLEQTRRLAAQLQEALTSRIPIEQAKGALARQHGIDPEAAFELLRGYARRHRRNLTEVATGWLAHPERFADLGPDAPRPR